MRDAPAPTPVSDARPVVSDEKFKFITKVGVEFEGGWISRPSFTVHSDGSVSCDGEIRGESHTDPVDNMKSLFDEIKAKYPDIVNQSCGMHVHISLPELYYTFLTTSKFWEYFCTKMPAVIEMLKSSKKTVDYERFNSRFMGGNTYCKKEFRPHNQIWETHKGSDRYTMLNFCYGLHHTMECRLFPMCESISNARLIITEYLHIVESFLAEHKETITYRIDVDVPEDPESGKEEVCVS